MSKYSELPISPLSTREILRIVLKPHGLRVLNPFAWWRWFRVRSYADHVRSLNPIIYMPMDDEEPTDTPS